MKKLGILLWLYLSFYSVKGQGNRLNNCFVLEKTLSTNSFNLFFNDSLKERHLHIIDTSRYFQDCHFVINERNINIMHQWEHWMPDLGNNFAYKDYLILYSIKKIKKDLYLSFWHPYGNGTIEFCVKRKKKKLLITEVGRGTY